MGSGLPELIKELESKLKSSSEEYATIRLEDALHDAYNSYYLQFDAEQLEEKILNDLYRQWPDMYDFEADLKKVVQGVIKDQADK